jgi:hypothetical protein
MQVSLLQDGLPGGARQAPFTDERFKFSSLGSVPTL